MRQRGCKYTPIMFMAALCFFALVGCSNRANQIAAPPALSQAELLSGNALFGPEGSNLKLPDVRVMELSDEMRDYLNNNISKKASKREKLNRLLFLIFSQEKLGITYDPSQTSTAKGTFKSGRGNCLAVSYLFSSMAKELGLTTHFQNVSIPPLWGMQNDVIYRYRHVNVKVPLTNSKTYIVDVNWRNNLPIYETNRISEKYAIAQYYSNKGADFLIKNDSLSAFLHFKKAITISPNQAEFWSNLGVLYSREKRYDYAESAYQTALGLQQDNLTIFGNMASLYSKMGDAHLEDKYHNLADRESNKNPYFRYIQASRDFQAGDYSSSLSNIEWALKREKNEPKFYYLLAQIYEEIGQAEKAQSANLEGQKIAKELHQLLTDKSMHIKYYTKN